MLVRDADKARKQFPNCDVIQGNITSDDLGIKQPMKLDAIYHLAADINLGTQFNDRVWATNFQGTVNVVRFCQQNSVPHLFYAGTAYTEKGRNIYERSKKAAEQFVDSSNIQRKTIFKIGILVPSLKDAVNASTGALYQFVNGISMVLNRAQAARRRLDGRLRLPVAQPKFRVKGIPDASLNLVHVDVVADFTISSLLGAPNSANIFMVTYPLHKGADGWMSQKQFETFYWPSLKKVMDAFIKEGLLQNMFAEGGYNTRLETVNDFAKGTVSWYFDRTDMFKAKKILGAKCAIQGNVPSSLVVTGAPEEMKEYCRKLIEGCGPGGGFILSAGAVAENPKLDNLRAMLAAVREYGVYKK